MSNLILIRHGTSLWNKEKRFTGWVDVDLHEEGEYQAENAGKLIKDLQIDFHGYFTSQLKRAINTLNIILKILNRSNSVVNKAWELNERHYGNLTSLNKDEVIKKFGFEQVRIWRRSFDKRPPPIEKNHPYINEIKSNILTESLEDTVKRVIPYFDKNILPIILEKKNVLVSFHGNSCRALLMKIFNISKKNIIECEVPTGNPLLIRFGNNLKIQDYKYLDAKRAKKILFDV